MSGVEHLFERGQGIESRIGVLANDDHGGLPVDAVGTERQDVAVVFPLHGKHLAAQVERSGSLVGRAARRLDAEQHVGLRSRRCAGLGHSQPMLFKHLAGTLACGLVDAVLAHQANSLSKVYGARKLGHLLRHGVYAIRRAGL